MPPPPLPRIFRIQNISEIYQDIFWHIHKTVTRSDKENHAIFKASQYSEFWHI